MTYGVERHEVEALRDNLLGEILAEPDPLRRYHELSSEQALYDALVSEIKRLRGKALAQVREQGGLTLEKTAEVASLGSRQRAGKLIEAGSKLAQ